MEVHAEGNISPNLGNAYAAAYTEAPTTHTHTRMHMIVESSSSTRIKQGARQRGFNQRRTVSSTAWRSEKRSAHKT